jgi:hypothetical protein
LATSILKWRNFSTSSKSPNLIWEMLMASARENSAGKAVAEYYAANKKRFDVMFSSEVAPATVPQ